MVGAPGQREKLDLLGVGAGLDRAEFVEPGPLPIGAARALRRQVRFAPGVEERAGDQHEPGDPLGMGEQEIAGDIGAERMPDQNDLFVPPHVEQPHQIRDVAGDRVLAFPARPAGAALVIAMHQTQVGDEVGDGCEIVGHPRTAVNHDHRRPLRGRVAHCPGAQPHTVIQLDQGRGHGLHPSDEAFIDRRCSSGVSQSHPWSSQ
ncbi:hypothetical protein Afe04nite_37180 [Asanoa ferruginea]|nr:hypothetical protein [Asanoa ferruginea]GIF49179.1 hypothetical protein Afe04nite_37180 [Asanoa ferruginea]